MRYAGLDTRAGTPACCATVARWPLPLWLGLCHRCPARCRGLPGTDQHPDPGALSILSVRWVAGCLIATVAHWLVL